MSKQYVSLEYQASIAWFKLAELVTRGERERAFNIYRLLIHALNDDAYSAQLKGDLWYSFNEYERAREAYYHAIAWYDCSERHHQSAFVHERLAVIEYSSLALRISMVTRFAELSLRNHVVRYVNELLMLAAQQNQLEFCISSLNEAHCSAPAHRMIQDILEENYSNDSELLSSPLALSVFRSEAEKNVSNGCGQLET